MLAQKDLWALTPSCLSPDIWDPVLLCLLRASPLPNFTPLEAPRPPGLGLKQNLRPPPWTLPLSLAFLSLTPIPP